METKNDKIVCKICNSTILKKGLKRHQKTKKCMKARESKETKEICDTKVNEEKTEQLTEKELLIKNQNRRVKALQDHKEFLDNMIKVKKGTRYRKWLYMMLKKGASTLFESDDDEYRFVNKFYRGMWYNVCGTFKKKEEMENIVALANDYGSFDY